MTTPNNSPTASISELDGVVSLLADIMREAIPPRDPGFLPTPILAFVVNGEITLVVLALDSEAEVVESVELAMKRFQPTSAAFAAFVHEETDDGQSTEYVAVLGANTSYFGCVAAPIRRFSEASPRVGEYAEHWNALMYSPAHRAVAAAYADQ